MMEPEARRAVQPVACRLDKLQVRRTLVGVGRLNFEVVLVGSASRPIRKVRGPMKVRLKSSA